MNKGRILAGVLLISMSVGVTGCKQESADAAGKNNNVTIIKDTKDIKATKTAKVKTDTYEGVSGVSWIDENNIIVSKVNKELQPIKIDTNTVKADFDMTNLYLYDLDSKSEKVIGDKSEYTKSGVVSPDQKHIFYTSENEEDGTGYISDRNGNIITKISDSDIDAYDLINANWINDKQIIIPCHSIGGFAIINVDGNIEKIKDVEKTNNKDDEEAISIVNPVKVGDKIYYNKMHVWKEGSKLIVYDTKTKEKKMLIKDEVLEFKLSNNKDQLVAIIYNSDKNIHELTTMDLEGENRQILTEGSISSVSWSKDGSKIAYTSYEEYESGVYIVDTKTKEKKLVTEGDGYYDVVCSPSGKKLMVNRTVDDEKPSNDDKLFPEQISTTNIISFE